MEKCPRARQIPRLEPVARRGRHGMSGYARLTCPILAVLVGTALVRRTARQRHDQPVEKLLGFEERSYA